MHLVVVLLLNQLWLVPSVMPCCFPTTLVVLQYFWQQQATLDIIILLMESTLVKLLTHGLMIKTTSHHTKYWTATSYDQQQAAWSHEDLNFVYIIHRHPPWILQDLAIQQMNFDSVALLVYCCYRAEITSYLHTYLSYLSIIQYTYQIIDRLLNPETFSLPL